MDFLSSNWKEDNYMQFNIDCAIDIMNFIIDTQTLNNGVLTTFTVEDLCKNENLSKYSNDLIIFYALLKLYEGNYLNAIIKSIQNKNRIEIIKGLTIRGHEFCEHLKDTYVFQKVKEGINQNGKNSLAYAEIVIHDCLIKASIENLQNQ